MEYVADDQDSKSSVFCGKIGKTLKDCTHISCHCGHSICIEIYRSIDVAANPSVLELFYTESINIKACSACGAHIHADTPVVIHDSRIPIVILYIPQGQRIRELELISDYYIALSREKVDIPAYAKEPRVFYQVDHLREYLNDPANAPISRRTYEAEVARERKELETKEEELLAREDDLLVREEKLVATSDRLRQEEERLNQWSSDLDREREALRALSIDLSNRERMNEESVAGTTRPPILPKDALLSSQDDKKHKVKKNVDLGKKTTDAFIKSKDKVRFVSKHSECVFLLKEEKTIKEKLGAPHVTVALIDFENEPLVVVTIRFNTEALDKTWRYCFDPYDKNDQEILKSLAKKFSVVVELYAAKKIVEQWEVQLPLSENVLYILERCAALIERQSDPSFSFEERRARFDALEEEEKQGKKQHNFSKDSFCELLSPASTRLALGIVSYWSEKENEDYLIMRKSFPLLYWESIKERVINKSIEFGLRMPDHLMEFSLRKGLIPSKEQAIKNAISSFAEVSLRIKPCDLDAVYEWENWRLLLADCADYGIVVESQIEDLAAASARKARDMSAPFIKESDVGGDVSLLESRELENLLNDRALRRDAALELCARQDKVHAEKIFDSLSEMTRDEVAVVIPAMLQFGDSMIPLFIEGLSQRKSFIRQGCALALGSLATPESAEALLGFLLKEPTRIWMEAARSMGDLGVIAIPSIRNMVEKADGEGRERIAWALANIALTEKGHQAVRDDIGGSKQAVGKKLAWRALEMLDHVRRNDAEVRGDRPLSDQTIVRRFSRHFFEAKADKERSYGVFIDEEQEVADLDILDESILESHEGIEPILDEAELVSDSDLVEDSEIVEEAEIVEVEDKDIL